MKLFVYDRYRYLAHERYYYGFGSQTLSMSLLIFVQEGNSIDINFYDLCEFLYGNETVRATLSLFLYQPIVGSRIAWVSSNECSHDPANPLQFNFISVNEGSGFIVKPPYEYKFVCPEAGLYYIHLHVEANSIQFTLLLNNQPIANGVLKLQFSSFARDTVSRAVILRLNVNDVLTVSIVMGSSINIEDVVFSGLKLY